MSSNITVQVSAENNITVSIALGPTAPGSAYREVTSGPVQMLATDGTVCLLLASAAACSILGATSRVPGVPYTFTDGNATASPSTPITYTPAGGKLINGQADMEITSPGESWTTYADSTGNEHIKS